ncbi:HAD family hydrolase [Shewanella sp. SR44-3]|uniref:HAD family hydrolase n=1 Tax=Shewanella sp. SR44-3 TaxID=2760936 RepID=UPI0015FA1051|nr:HAD-IA family hydrolase [Shewanella sp. SR44-3]MBB1268558.1 HAD family hydrolase [Shewanella sp. SR44-3]
MIKLKGIIFDLDGTLVTSSLDFSLIRQQINCPEQLDVLVFVDTLTCVKTKAHANNVIAWHEQQDALSAQALPGMTDLFDALEKAQLPSAIVTRNSQSASALKVSNNRIPIQLVLTREDYPPKPAPDALLAIASLWQLEPQSILYVGDYLYDIQAAFNAGMQSCFINHGRESAYQAQADLVITHLDELTALLNSLENN